MTVRLDDLKAKYGEKIRVEWKSFMLRPTAQGAKSRAEFVEYTRLWSRMPETDTRLVVTSPWASDDPHPSHSVPALVAMKIVEAHGEVVADDFHHRVFNAYFNENRTISDVGVLAAIAEEAGLDAGQFKTDFVAKQEAIEAQVIAEHNEAIQLGVSGVPFTVVDNQVAISGAQDTAVFVEVIDKMLADH